MQTLARHAVICLNEDWSVQSSAKLSASGAELSRASTKVEGWYKASVPATVLGTLVEAGVYPDPFFGMNLREIPGHGPFAQNFSNHPMPDDSPFAVSWWFRREFKVPKGADRVVLRFDGVNYRANLWALKEAVLKGLGTGLRRGARSVQLRPLEEGWVEASDGARLWSVRYVRQGRFWLAVAV